MLSQRLTHFIKGTMSVWEHKGFPTSSNCTFKFKNPTLKQPTSLPFTLPFPCLQLVCVNVAALARSEMWEQYITSRLELKSDLMVWESDRTAGLKGGNWSSNYNNKRQLKKRKNTFWAIFLRNSSYFLNPLRDQTQTRYLKGRHAGGFQNVARKLYLLYLLAGFRVKLCYHSVK